MATRTLASASRAISAKEAANPSVLLIVETVVVVMLEIMAASLFLALNNVFVKFCGTAAPYGTESGRPRTPPTHI